VTPVRLLVVSAALQMVFAIVVGFLMLIPMQPWGRGLGRLLPRPRELGSAHLDWIVLALAQFAAAFALQTFPVAGVHLCAWLLVIGGWLNPLPYVFRGYGVNAFVLGGPSSQRAASLVALSSSLALAGGWGLLAYAWLVQTP
jgi:hypothetical protein